MIEIERLAGRVDALTVMNGKAGLAHAELTDRVAALVETVEYLRAALIAVTDAVTRHATEAHR